MSWGATLYVQFATEAQARAMAEQLGALVVAITEWVARPPIARDGSGDPGQARPGYWAMLRFNTGWAGYNQAMATLTTVGVLRTLDHSSNVFA